MITVTTNEASIAQLQQEFWNAGLQFAYLNVLGRLDTGNNEVIFYGSNHRLIDYSEDAAAISVAAAHVPTPMLTFNRTVNVGNKVRTLNATPTELYRAQLRPLTGYDVVIRLLGVDAGNGVVKKLVVDFTVKRLNGAPSQVGGTSVAANHSDTAAATWNAGFTFDGNDLVIQVTGAAGRTIDWAFTGSVNSFAPSGE